MVDNNRSSNPRAKGKKVQQGKARPVVDEVDEEIEERSLLDFIDVASGQRIKLLSGKSIHTRGWKMAEEKDLLFATETQMDDREAVIDECLKLSKKCVDEKDYGVFDGLSKNDLVDLICQQRKLSKGKDIDINFRCINEKCKTWVKYTPEEQEVLGKPAGESSVILNAIIDLDEDIVVENYNDGPFKVGKYTFHPKEVSHVLQVSMEEMYITAEELNLNKFNWEFNISSIKAVEVDGALFEDPSEAVLSQLVGSLTKKQYDVLSKKIGTSLSDFKIEKKVKCPQCKNESPIGYSELFSLLVF